MKFKLNGEEISREEAEELVGSEVFAGMVESAEQDHREHQESPSWFIETTDIYAFNVNGDTLYIEV